MTAQAALNWRYYNDLIGEILFNGFAKEGLNGWLEVKLGQHKYLRAAPGRIGMSLPWELWTDDDTDGREFVCAASGDVNAKWTGNLQTDVVIFRDSLANLIAAV